MLNRRLLMAQAGGTPPGILVTDGLVFHLDGLNRGGVSGQWIELIHGWKYILKGSVSERNECVEFDGGYAECKIQRLPAEGAGTVQVAISPGFTSSKSYVVFSPQFNGTLGMGIDSGSILFGTIQGEPSKKLRYKENLSNGLNYTISGSVQNCYVNKNAVARSGGSFWNARGLSRLACREWGNAVFRGKIFSVRMYNRILTEAEILQNQQHDIDTYFGGVIPE